MKVEELGTELCRQLQRGQLTGSLAVSRRAAEFLKALIIQKKHPDALSMLQDVRESGRKLQRAKQSELVIGNVVRRVLHLIREAEGEDFGPTEDTSPSFPFSASTEHSLDALAAKPQWVDKSRPAKTWKGKKVVLDGIAEFLDELDGIPAQIAHEGLGLIHANEVVLTFGYSDTVLEFLIEASKDRPGLEVIVAEAAPRLDGHRMAHSLIQANVKATVIADAAIFALMARVDKVFVGCHAAVADGGVVAKSGTILAATAAQYHSVPVVALVGTHKISPVYPRDPFLTLNEFRSPHEIVSYPESISTTQTDVLIANPGFDFVEHELINLLLTDQGGMTPSCVYQLMTEFYSKEDYDLND